MNFLAHSLFGFNNPALIAGQFCGDFVRGNNLSHLPPDLERGIRLHRYLDQYTDTHPVLLIARDTLPGVRRRFAGIVIDVMFDHYLARQWEQVSDVSLARHVQGVHAALSDHEAHFPEELRRFMIALQQHDILQNNIHIEAIEKTLARIARRSSTFDSLKLNTGQLKPLREILFEPFARFYPDVQGAAQRFIDTH